MESQLRQINCSKSVTGSDFSLGVQDYNVQVGGSTVLHPNQSFFAIETELKVCKLVAGNLTLVDPEPDDQIALAYNHVSTMYDNVSFTGGGSVMSSINAYIPQAHTIKTRLGKSGAWQSTQGADIYNLDPDFNSRVIKSCGGSTIDSLKKINVGADTFELSRTMTFLANNGNVIGVNTDFDGSVKSPAVANRIPLVRKGDVVVCPTETGGFTRHEVIKVVDATNLEVFPGLEVAVTQNPLIFIARDFLAQAGKNTTTTLYRPSIGVFETEQLGAGSYRISLNPNSRYQKAAVESVLNRPVYDENAKVAGAFRLSVKSVKFYASMSKDTVQLSGVETLFLNEQTLQTKQLNSDETSLDFTVPSSTQMIAFVVQTGKAGSDTRYSPTKFVAEAHAEQFLDSFQLTYANTSKPSIRFNSEFSAKTSTIAQRFHDTYSEAGMSELQGGTESLSTWVESPIFAYSFLRDSSDRSTQLQLNINFRRFMPPNTNIIICAFHTRTCEVSYNQGLITDVRTLTV